MTYLISGLALYAALRLGALVPSQKAMILARTGDRYYPLFVAFVSALALYLVVEGWRETGAKPVFETPAWGDYANFVLTFLAFIGVGISLFRGRLRQIVRYPVALSVWIWGAGHLLSSSDLRNFILFNSMMLLAAVHIWLSNQHKIKPSPEVRSGHDLMSVVAGAALFGIASQMHGALIGVPVFALTR